MAPKIKTIHKELDGLTSEDALQTLYVTACDILKNREKKDTESAPFGALSQGPVLFLLGGFLPLMSIAQNVESDKELLLNVRDLIISLQESLEHLGCYVQVQNSEDFVKSPPENMSSEQRMDVIKQLIDDMPNELQGKVRTLATELMEKMLLGKLDEEKETMN